ncbi:hypothetical protein RF11_00233 [Thelohanellus kitauei]|uniref:Uncharacterized protein n=1 Tax=Thelohanellus kitauei TaxID=669202 RepID=A0A0C2JYU1_THEKT|nr:hypothetical protein RF11_00233 [Thelohanellus kitauei]
MKKKSFQMGRICNRSITVSAYVLDDVCIPHFLSCKTLLVSSLDTSSPELTTSLRNKSMNLFALMTLSSGIVEPLEEGLRPSVRECIYSPIEFLELLCWSNSVMVDDSAVSGDHPCLNTDVATALPELRTSPFESRVSGPLSFASSSRHKKQANSKWISDVGDYRANEENWFRHRSTTHGYTAADDVCFEFSTDKYGNPSASEYSWRMSNYPEGQLTISIRSITHDHSSAWDADQEPVNTGLAIPSIVKSESRLVCDPHPSIG